LTRFVTSTVPLTSRFPANFVVIAIRSSSERSDWYSLSNIVRSLRENWPEEACTASIFARTRISVTFAIAPSAIWRRLPAWRALTVACSIAITSAFRAEPMAWEAASSFADTTREPEDSLLSELVAAASEFFRLRWAMFAAKLEMTFNAMSGSSSVLARFQRASRRQDFRRLSSRSISSAVVIVLTFAA